MKTVEGLLRYDRLDMGEWCFDMGYQIIPALSGMQMCIQFLDERFHNAKLIETAGNELTVVFDDRRRTEPLSFTLEKSKRYPARMLTKTVDDILDSARLLDVERELQREKNPEPDTNSPDDDDFYF